MSALYLCRPGGGIIGTMSGLDENSVNLKRQIGDFWNLTFDINRYELNNTHNPKETTYYHSISDGMELLLESTDFSARFKITEEPTINNDGVHEKKSVTANSIECELQNKFLKTFYVNTGISESLENLVLGNLARRKVGTTDTTQDLYNYNLNPYTNLPVEYISLYRRVAITDQFTHDATNQAIYWAETGTTYSYTLNSTTGEITATDSTFQDEFVELFKTMISNYPRIQGDIYWVVDDENYQQLISPPDNKIVSVILSYVEIVDGSVYLVKPKYAIEYDDTNEYYKITGEYSGSYTSDILDNGINSIASFQEQFGDQLSLLDLTIEQMKISGWTIGNVPKDMMDKKYTFSIDSQDIYSTLTNTYANAMKVIFDFDRLNKKVNLINVSEDDEEHDTGVIIGFHNLMNSIDIKTASEDGIKTKFNVSGADGLGILYANFGDNSIVNLDYFMSKVDQYGNRQFVTDDLYNKYQDWKAYRYTDEIALSDVPEYTYNARTKEITSDTTTTLSGTRLEIYQQLSEYYNQSLIDIDEIINLVPNDGVRVDYMTFSYDELKTVWTAYNNAFYALLELYKADYGAVVVYPNTPWLRVEQRVSEDDVYGLDKDGNRVTSILDTMYCHDFSGYYYNIIPNVIRIVINTRDFSHGIR